MCRRPPTPLPGGGIVYSYTADPPPRLQDNSPTNQLAVSQVADWITRALRSTRRQRIFKNHGITIGSFHADVSVRACTSCRPFV